MEAILPIAFALLLSGAALGKADAWRSWTESAAQFVTSGYTPFLRWGVPVIEVAIAVLIIISPGVGLAAASALFGAFALGALLLQRRHAGVACNCFGSLSRSRMGMPLVIRNALLAALSGAGAAVIGPDAPSLEAVEITTGALLAASLALANVAYRSGTLSMTQPAQKAETGV